MKVLLIKNIRMFWKVNSETMNLNEKKYEIINQKYLKK